MPQAGTTQARRYGTTWTAVHHLRSITGGLIDGRGALSCTACHRQHHAWECSRPTPCVLSSYSC